MRIAYVTSGYTPLAGGVETHVEELVSRMAERGFDIEVLTQHADPTLPRIEVMGEVLVRRFPVLFPAPIYPFSPALWRYLVAHSGRYDLVHAHNYHAFPALGAALLAPSTPMVFTPHYHDVGHRPLGKLLHRPYRLAGHLMFKRSAAIICVSRQEVSLLQRRYPATAGRIHVIPNGVDVTALQRAKPHAIDEKVVLTVGRLLDYKNVQGVIDALPHLDGRFSLYVIGVGPHRPSLEALTRELGLANRVHFLGMISQPELYRWYRTASIYVSLSREEAFGLTLLEAAAAGAPVVASSIPSHTEIADLVGAARFTLLPPDAPGEVVAAALETAARTPAEEPKVQIAIPTWDDVAEKTVSVYERVLGGLGQEISGDG